MFGLVLLLTIVLAVLLGPWLYPVDPKAIDISASGQPPSAVHPMGDGRSGARHAGTCAVWRPYFAGCRFHGYADCRILGTTVGLLAGYIRQFDSPLMRFTDMMLTLPKIPLLLVAAGLSRDPLRAQCWHGNGCIHHGRHGHWHSGLDDQRHAWCAALCCPSSAWSSSRRP